jgi:hypothetical protein
MELRPSVRRRVFGNCAFGGFWDAPFEGRPVPSFEVGRQLRPRKFEIEELRSMRAARI